MVRVASMWSLLYLTAWGAVTASEVASAAARQEFDQRIAPVLIQRCVSCHSGDHPKGGLDLSQRRAALNGGDSGEVIVPGKPEESLLWEYLRDGKMPPRKPLAERERRIFKAWIETGAVWGTDPIDPFRVTTDRRAGYDWWALQPVGRSRLPLVRQPNWPRNGIDAFVLARLEAHELAPQPEADRRTLIRRLSFDLLGLPPTPEEVDAFRHDPGPDAYERLVDRLLASPLYGIRWARHWLDVVRFGESQGFERDIIRDHAWPYRDWVVQALNKDLPYDQFVRLQIAGDVLYPDNPAALAATGFLVAGPYDEVGQKQQSTAMRAVVRQDELEDIVSVVGQTFLGLTVNCARCHDHKFDPIRQKEYYQLCAALDGVRHGEREIRIPASPSVEYKPQRIYAVAPGALGPTHVLRRGNPSTLAEAVAPGGIAALANVSAEFSLEPNASEAQRRVQLANWLTHLRNPLFPRVIVNRLWHYHFGVGLVDSPNDFGFNGGRPSHPDLLDYLASEFMQHDRSLKYLHRQIVTSATYRQASRHDARAAAVDADSRLLWRKVPLRLEAEVLRDALLAIAGELNQQMGGPGYRDFTTFTSNSQFYVMQDREGPAYQRRSLYRTWIRSGRNPLLDTFDCPDPSTKTPRRAATVTPLQALALMNNSFVLRMAERLAERLRSNAGTERASQIRRAYQLLYGRDPQPEELELTTAFVSRHGLSELCRVLFNSNEFLYPD